MQTVSRCEGIRLQREGKTCIAEDSVMQVFLYKCPLPQKRKVEPTHAKLHHHRPDPLFPVPPSSVLGIPLHGRLGLSPSSHGLASSSPDGQPAWHGWRVQGRSPWSLLIFPLIFGAESSPPRSFLTRQEDVRMARAVISHPSIFLKPAINILWQICIGIAKMHGIDFA